MEKKGRALERFAKLVTLQVSLLIVQFVVGIVVNLYAEIPQVLGAAFWDSPSAWMVKAHMLLALAVLAVGGILLRESRRMRSRHIWNSSVLGFLGVIISFVSGLAFLFGGLNDIFSLVMALGFILAFSAYGFAWDRYAVRPVAPL